MLAAMLIIVQHVYPDLVIQYNSKSSQLLDLDINMIISLAILGFMTILLKRNYDGERQKVELHAKQLNELNATKDKFFSIISHDLRNPFSNLLGLSHMLRSNLDSMSRDEILEQIEAIEFSSKSGYDLLSNLLEWSMSQSGNIIYSPAFLKLKNVVDECLSVIENQAVNKKVIIISTVSVDLFVKADFNMLKIIFRNLVTNAVKYSYPEGLITISAHDNDSGAIEISISDRGIGIPAAEIDKLFRIDTKYSTAGTANESGTGLGLILSKEFVDRHGGKIWVESVPGKGSTFKFTLPK